jgi:hypothetical protein
MVATFLRIDFTLVVDESLRSTDGADWLGGRQFVWPDDQIRKEGHPASWYGFILQGRPLKATQESHRDLTVPVFYCTALHAVSALDTHL